MLKFNSTLLRTAMLATALGAFAVPALAQDADTVAPAAAMSSHAAKRDAMVEQRIQTLHDKLKITPEQEDDWSKVAATMRDNEESIHDLIKERHDNGGSMTAIDDMENYQKIVQAHADGLAKTIPAFETLYNDMSDDQKKNADKVFSSFNGPHGKMKHKKSS